MFAAEPLSAERLGLLYSVDGLGLDTGLGSGLENWIWIWFVIQLKSMLGI